MPITDDCLIMIIWLHLMILESLDWTLSYFQNSHPFRFNFPANIAFPLVGLAISIELLD